MIDQSIYLSIHHSKSSLVPEILLSREFYRQVRSSPLNTSENNFQSFLGTAKPCSKDRCLPAFLFSIFQDETPLQRDSHR